MPDAGDLERAKALLERTRQILASVEAEVARLAEETSAAQARLREWEATLVHLLPEEPTANPTGPDVVPVAAPERPGATQADGSSVVAVERREGPRVVTRE